MDEPTANLVHTNEEAFIDSTSYAPADGTVERGASSSAGERPLHTRKVVGSKPSSPTVDPIAKMLADDAWRMKVEERFWPKVMKVGDWVACWEWSGARKKDDPKQGYGNFKLTSRVSVRAHRVSWAIYNGRSPGEWLVLHSCDNPPCVNPLHLFLGTDKTNSDDKIAKGRARYPDQAGEKNGAAKLTAADVERIKALIEMGMNNKRIAAGFGVSHALISRIRRGRSWGAEPLQPKYASLRRQGASV